MAARATVIRVAVCEGMLLYVCVCGFMFTPHVFNHMLTMQPVIIASVCSICFFGLAALVFASPMAASIDLTPQPAGTDAPANEAGGHHRQKFGAVYSNRMCVNGCACV